MDLSKELWREIQDQPITTQRVLDDPALQQQIEELARKVESSGELLISGMGASLHAGESVASLLRLQGYKAWTLPTSELVHYAPQLGVTPVLLISQSGESAEILHFLEQKPEVAFGLTLNSDSPLAAQRCLVLPGGPERAFAATRSFTSTVAALLMLAQQLGASVDLAGIPHALERALEREKQFDLMLDTLRGNQTLFFTGRGPLHGLANYVALMFMELCRIPSFGMEAAQLRHGPLEVGQQGVAVTAFKAVGGTGTLITKLVRDFAETGSHSILVDASEPPTEALDETYGSVLHVRVEAAPEADAILPLSIPSQLVAYKLAQARKITPGVPLRSSKVTREE